MISYRCPYCHTNGAKHDKYHAGRCENCGGALEAIVIPPGYPSESGFMVGNFDCHVVINHANFDRDKVQRELNDCLEILHK